MSQKSLVSVAGCSDYQLPKITLAIKSTLDYLGGLARFVQPGQIVAVKPNLISRKKPEDAATTHPLVVEAVVRLIQEAGGQPFIIDSPGGPSSKGC
ncbi:hypothetical protein N752_15655 [Desulforamulus aquiferis]|nr:DUF362 domain-containing protein [Desulforamulus aquiferis]RYD04278.1 hypothetical protein N752_15655 [Desulforamulus aquiferis]